MPKVVGAKLAYSSSELWFNPVDLELNVGDKALFKTARGLEMGTVTRAPFEVSREMIVKKTGNDWLKTAERFATEQDLLKAQDLQEEAARAHEYFKEEVQNLGLEMKTVGVDILFDESKAICYFAAEERVDFRELIKKLAQKLDRKIEMHQIGSRQEAAICGGIAHCGCEYCCTRWQREFSPVSIRMAKDQDLSINSEGISGSCGRLMCCLRFETDCYKEFKKRAPKKGSTIQTPAGEATVVGFNTPKELVDIKINDSGKRFTIPLQDMSASKAAHKKAAENNCPLRPDTVSQDVFEQLGMAGLDALVGTLEAEPAPTPKHEEPKKPERTTARISKKVHGMRPKKQRRRQNAAAKEQPQEQKPHEKKPSATRRIRRHRKQESAPARDVRPGRHQREGN